jgi:hypothetical protein
MRLKLAVLVVSLFVIAPAVVAESPCASRLHEVTRWPLSSTAEVDRMYERLKSSGLREPGSLVVNILDVRLLLAEAVEQRKAIANLELLEPMFSSDPRARKVYDDIRQKKLVQAAGLKQAAEYRTAIINAAIEERCGAETPPPPPPHKPPQHHARGTFYRDDSLTKVTNTHQCELKIDPTGQSAHQDNRRCGSGATWQVEYTWHVPEVLIAGEESEVTISAEVEGVQPRQDLSMGIDVRVPDAGKQVIAHYPTTPIASDSLRFKVGEGYRDSNELTITVGFLSSGVTYVYRRR